MPRACGAEEPSLIPDRRAAAALSILLVTSCRREGAPDHVSTARLDLGPATPIRLPPPADRSELRLFPDRPHETRPAVSLRAGGALEATATVGAGAALELALGYAGPPLPGVLVAVEILVNGRVARRASVPADPRSGWQPMRVDLDVQGPVRFAFRRPSDGARAAEGGDPAVLVSAPRVVPRARPARRVLVWVSQDTLRADHLGAYGYERGTSPGFDRRAAGWAVFEDAVATAPWTLPSLASQFTSRYPSFHGAVLETLTRDPAHPTVFEVLAREGFTVVGVSANRFVSPEFVMASGFDMLWFTPGDAREVTSLALRLVEAWAAGDLALFVHYMDPHFPYTPPPPYDGLFGATYRGRVTGRNFLRFPRHTLGAADLARIEALYDGEIAHADAEIDRLLGSLERSGLLQSAVLAYTSDHGEEFLEHGAWTHSQTLYEEVLQVPLALRVPGLAPRRIQEPVSLVDLAPTVLDVFGIPAPPSFQGASLLPLMRGRSRPSEPLYAETEHTHKRLNHKVAVRDAAWKLVAVVPRGREARPPILEEAAYDLQADPAEKRGSGSGGTRRERLRRLALAYLTRARTTGSVTSPAELGADAEEGLRALGYIQ